jgi:hypothetical protein
MQMDSASAAKVSDWILTNNSPTLGNSDIAVRDHWGLAEGMNIEQFFRGALIRLALVVLDSVGNLELFLETSTFLSSTVSKTE